MAVLDSKSKLEALRRMMEERDLTAYVVPSEDAHASEYLAPCDARRAFLTSFTGSAGCAVVTKKSALCWTDGRYWLQAGKQLGDGWSLMKQGLPEVPTWAQWLKSDLPASSRIGIDPSLIPHSEYMSLSTSLSAASCESTLVPIKENLIDLIWSSARPAQPSNDIFHLADQFTGETVGQKISSLREKLVKTGSPGMVVGQLDEVAWMLNLRGSDIPYNPVFFAYAVLTSDECTVFVQSASLSDAVRKYLHENGVAVLDYHQFWNSLETLGERVKAELKQNKGMNRDAEAKTSKSMEDGEKVVRTDKLLIGRKMSWAVAKAVGEDNVEVRRSMIQDAKAKKNATEIEGFRLSHIRDGAALVRYFAWLKEALHKGEKWSEYDAAQILENYRKQNKWFMGLSFETISSTGPNAAIIHYAPPKEGSAIIDRDQMYLCDSGAQYMDGTTDTTRTWHFGTPSDEEKRAFTRVLQGHISLDTIVFPQGTTGFVLDILARKALWSDGLDYRHSTSHGVGAFLNVHEGPHGVGQPIGYNEVALRAGMVMSNEPGYYAEGKYGIRIENIDVIRMAETRENFGGKGYLELEHVTMCPIQSSLVQLELLSPAERTWLNSYHAEVKEKLTPLLREAKDERALDWLAKECEAV